jgi:hypothetical protein
LLFSTSNERLMYVLTRRQELYFPSQLGIIYTSLR